MLKNRIGYWKRAAWRRLFSKKVGQLSSDKNFAVFTFFSGGALMKNRSYWITAWKVQKRYFELLNDSGIQRGVA
jgi:hypothetical protein